MKFTVKTLNWLLGAVVVIVLVVIAANALELPKIVKVHGAIGDICDGRNLAEARTTLELAGDRQYVLDAIKEALEDADGTVLCKSNLLQTLGTHGFNQPRVIRRALDSEVESTRRAACSILYGSPELRDRCAEIAVAWLADEDADERHKAALICGQLELEEARPALLAIVGREPQTMADLQLFQQALSALRGTKVEGLAERLLAMVRDEKLSEAVRGQVLQSLQGMEHAPRDEFQATLIALLRNRDLPTLRQNAALALARFPTETAWDALEEVLLDESQAAQHGILQRHCLKALADSAPLDRVRRLLLDRRVYRHPYFGIRIDVCTAVAALDMREGIVLDILTEYLVDDDPKAREQRHIVRSEAWLSLWVLTGTAYGIGEPELFRRPPPPLPDPERARDRLLARAYLRPGVKAPQAQAAETMALDLATMQRVRETYSNLKQEFLKRWQDEQAAKAKPQEPPPAPLGPKPPPKDDAEGDGG